MMRRVIVSLMFVIVFTGKVYSFDKELAKRFNEMFSMMTPEVIAQRPCEINAKQLFEMIKKKEPFIFLDVRTPQEMAIVGITWKNKLEIPMNELFKEENLKKLPKDQKIVVVCHTGTRAAAVVLALRAVGFTQAYMFKGGIAEMGKEVGRSVVGTVD
ncbi:MAG: rhodanese-like domain-containing protein [Caldimicrobium sp.]